MLTRALWMKEYKQSKILLWVLLAIFFFDYPIRISSQLESWRQIQKDAITHNFDFVVDEWMVRNLFGGGFSTFMSVILIVLLAGLLIGAERNTRKNDFSFALPFKRSQMFITKWLIGTLAIITFYSINFFVAYFIISSSEYAEFLVNVSPLNIFMSAILGYIAMYSFALLIGTISGEMISQMVLTFIFTFFPLGFFVLIESFYSVHFGSYLNQPRFLEAIVWPIYVFEARYHQDLNLTINLLIPFVAIIIFTVLANWLYSINKIEHNGEFLIFKVLHPVFRIGIIVCFALLGGMIISSLAHHSFNSILQIVFYWIGVGLFGFLSYLLTNRLLTMNVTVKNK